MTTKDNRPQPTERERHRLQAEAAALLVELEDGFTPPEGATDAEAERAAQAWEAKRARLRELIRAGMLGDTQPAQDVRPERKPALREIARQRFEAMQRRRKYPPVFLDNAAESECVHKEFFRLIGNANSEVAEIMRHQRDDAAALGAAHVRRGSVVAHLGSLPEGPTGDALRALDSDALQVYQLRQGMNAKGNRNTFEEVAAQFRSERKPGKKYTRARVQQIYRAAVKAFPALADYAAALATRDSIRLDRDPTDADSVEAPGAYSTRGRVNAEDAFDMSELDPDREGGVRYSVKSDLRNREI